MSSSDGKRVVVERALQVAPGVFLNPGEDVTDRITDRSLLWTHVKRGYVRILDAESVATAKPVVVTSQSDDVKTVVVEDTLPVESDMTTEALRSLNATASKFKLRKALNIAGVEVPEGATKDELLKMRAKRLAV